MARNPLEEEIVSNPAKEDLGADEQLLRSIFDHAQTDDQSKQRCRSADLPTNSLTSELGDGNRT